MKLILCQKLMNMEANLEFPEDFTSSGVSSSLKIDNSRPRRLSRRQRNRSKQNRSLKNGVASLNLDQRLSEERKSVSNKRAQITISDAINHTRREMNPVEDLSSHNEEQPESISTLNSANKKISMKFSMRDEFYPQSVVFRTKKREKDRTKDEIYDSHIGILEMMEDDLSEVQDEEDP